MTEAANCLHIYSHILCIPHTMYICIYNLCVFFYLYATEISARHYLSVTFGEMYESVPNGLLYNQFYECSVKAQRLHTYSSLPCVTWFWPMGCKWKRHVLLRQRVPLLSFYSVLLARMRRIYPSIYSTIYIWSSHLEMVPWDGSHMYRIVKTGLKALFRATLSVLEYLCLFHLREIYAMCKPLLL